MAFLENARSPSASGDLASRRALISSNAVPRASRTKGRKAIRFYDHGRKPYLNDTYHRQPCLRVSAGERGLEHYRRLSSECSEGL